VFVFVDEGLKGLSQWELFLRGHRPLVQRIGQAAFVYASAQPERFVSAERMFGRILTGTSSSGAFDLGRMKRYFEARKQFEARQYSTFDQLRLDQLREDRKVFVGERTEALYSGWCLSGDEVLAPVAAGGMAFQVHSLRHRYEWI